MFERHGEYAVERAIGRGRHVRFVLCGYVANRTESLLMDNGCHPIRCVRCDSAVQSSTGALVTRLQLAGGDYGRL
jgi:hypothetical protein